MEIRTNKIAISKWRCVKEMVWTVWENGRSDGGKTDVMHADRAIEPEWLKTENKYATT